MSVSEWQLRVHGVSRSQAGAAAGRRCGAKAAYKKLKNKKAREQYKVIRANSQLKRQNWTVKEREAHNAARRQKNAAKEGRAVAARTGSLPAKMRQRKASFVCHHLVTFPPKLYHRSWSELDREARGRVVLWACPRTPPGPG